MFVFKVNFEKAFDFVSWDYLFYVLKGMKFGSIWIKWIEACVYSNFLPVLINGSPIIEFQVRRGLRQVDPLSPFLLIIAAEGLVDLLRNACALSSFHLIKVLDYLEYDLLQFVNDTIILGQASWENI